MSTTLTPDQTDAPTPAPAAPGRPAALTAGFLPTGPFRHLEPTAVGELELDGEVLQLHSGDPALDRDALVLIRRHGEPVGFVHTSEPGDAAAIAAQARTEGVAGAGSAPGADPLPALPGSAAVIIPTGGRAVQLRRALESLLASLPAGVEVIVVDNRPGVGGTNACVREFAARDPRVRYLPENRPGSSVARNAGIAATEAEFVAFTDDDVVLDAGWLPWLLQPFTDRQVTATTGLVLPLELQTPAQKQFEQYAGFGKGLAPRSYDLATGRAEDRLMYPFWGGVFGSGNSMAFRRTELVDAGGFDPALGAGSRALAGADIEAMSTAILRGGRLAYQPRSLCWHEHRSDDHALRRQLYNYGVGCTAILAKHALRDRRFLTAAVRAPGVIRRLRRDRAADASPALPPELASLQRRGMLRGPDHYVRSVRWARGRRLGEVIAGR